MRTDDCEHSEWFDVTHGLRQGCVLSPFLLYVLFAAALHVVVVRFGEDEDIVREVVHLEEDVIVGDAIGMRAKGRVGHVVRR